MAMQSDSEEEINSINVTPLVDVCLVLVIIFMVTAPMMVQPNMAVVLPKASTKEGENKENITISISDKGEWAINQARRLGNNRRAVRGLSLCLGNQR